MPHNQLPTPLTGSPGLARLLAALCLAVQFAAPLPALDLTPGTRGYGLTVVEGTRIDTFGVEILGVQRKASLPGRDQILVRLSGLGLEASGIVRGMSGSPVYVDDQLIGAVAWGWLYAEEPVGLVTPIGEMLDLLAGDLADTGVATPAAAADGASPRLGVWLAGGGPGTLALAGQLLHPLGLEPLSVPAGADGEDAPAPPPGPGSAVALPLVQGDLSLAVIGTTTWVEDDQLVCFGHPFLGQGRIDLPLATARIHGILRNQAASFKLGVAGQTVGAARQDRVAGVAGVLGATAPVLPLRVDLATAAEVVDYRFDVARDPLLTASLCQISVLGSLESTFKAMGAASVGVRVEVDLADGRRVAWRRAYAGRNPFMMAALGLGPPLRALLDAPFADLQVEDVRVRTSVEERIRAARIESARLPRPTATPGATVDVTVDLAPWRGAARQVVVPVAVPADVSGTLRVRIGSGLRALDWEATRLGPGPAADSDALLARLGRAGDADELVVEVVSEVPGLAVDGRELPAPPPSVRRLLDGPHASGSVRRTPEVVVARARQPVDLVLHGEHVLTLTVVPAQ